jgi:phage antirepressor YoqD-like protein
MGIQNKTMTIKEFADLVGVEPESVKKHIREIYPDLMQNGITTLLNEEQITRIKARMRPTPLVVGSVTDLEMIERAMSVQVWALAKIEEQRKALLEAQPKIEFFDAVADSKGDRTIMEAAKLLKIPKPRSLYETLRLRGVLSNDNIPYQRYILDGFFRVNLTERNGRTYSTTYVTNKGLNWLQKKFAGATYEND